MFTTLTKAEKLELKSEEIIEAFRGVATSLSTVEGDLLKEKQVNAEKKALLKAEEALINNRISTNARIINKINDFLS